MPDRTLDLQDVCLDDEKPDSWTGAAMDADPENRLRGVYFLFKAHRLVYVGKSENMPKRIETHRTNGRPFDAHAMMHVPLAQADYIETALIRALQPAYNQHKKKITEPPSAPVVPAPRPALPPLVATDPDALLSKKHVRNLVLYSPSHIDRLEASGKFPKRVRLGEGHRARVGWRRRDVIDWLATKTD